MGKKLTYFHRAEVAMMRDSLQTFDYAVEILRQVKSEYALTRRDYPEDVAIAWAVLDKTIDILTKAKHEEIRDMDSYVDGLYAAIDAEDEKGVA